MVCPLHCRSLEEGQFGEGLLELKPVILFDVFKALLEARNEKLLAHLMSQLERLEEFLFLLYLFYRYNLIKLLKCNFVLKIFILRWFFA